MKKEIILILLLSVLGACAGQQLQNEWKTRGYEQADQDAITGQWKVYLQEKIQAEYASNRFNTGPIQAFDERLKKIFCACYKKMGEKCRQKPTALSAEDKVLWIKANAVDYTKVGQSMSWETTGMTQIDPVECQ